MRPLFSICQSKCPILKFLTPPYFRDMCYFHKVGIHCVIIKCTFIKKIMGLEPILNSFWPNLLVSIFWNFQKKNIFCSVLALFSKLLILPIFSRQATLQDKNQCHSINFVTTDLGNGSFWPSIPDGQNENLKKAC